VRARTPKLQPVAAKVPEITVLFWLVKILTTGIGEALSDFLGNLFVPLAAVVGAGGLWWALRSQLRAREYRAPVYWAAVLMVAVFGTMVADGVHDGAGIPYSVTTPLFALWVTGIFLRWRAVEGTLSIHSIVTRSREKYYWWAVLGTFALGTAAGDLTGIQLDMGFLDSALLFGVAIAVPLLAWRFLGLHPTIAFWSAYVVTRPLGASFADWFGKPHAQSGLGLGDGTVGGLGLLTFVAAVAYLACTRGDVQRPGEGHVHTYPHPQVHLDRPQTAERQLGAPRAAAGVQLWRVGRSSRCPEPAQRG
jgi:uncharacterized membrane-anchored protein